jgi:hypothetical protein
VTKTYPTVFHRLCLPFEGKYQQADSGPKAYM